ncbi:MAG: hypothetical protein RLN88_01860 [Ekhidna sp.]|uniref:hypothetical protein n=1 Tax=Ekhidna sp. TaxID=2608089 RepID=UPI0032F03FB8
MAKHLTYATTALILIALAKLLQVFVYDEASHVRKEDKVYYDEVKDTYILIDSLARDEESLDSESEVTSYPPGDSIGFNTEPKEVETGEAGGFEERPANEKNPSEVVEDPVAEVESKPVASSYPTLDDLIKNYLSIKNVGLEEGRSREDVVIRYYRHDKDENKVDKLKSLKYYIHEKQATETRGLGSNMIYYGENVAVEDIQIVAFTLLKNGIPLKSIQPSSYEWKSNAIEIGTDSDLIGAKNLTEEDIRNFSK